MSKNKFYWMGSGLFLFLCFILVTIYFFNSNNKEILHTYFTYNAKELDNLKKLTSSLEISKKELDDWDEITAKLIIKNKPEDKDVSRIYAYLYTAQTDVAFLSYNVKDKMMGSLSPVSLKILTLFFPKDVQSITD